VEVRQGKALSGFGKVFFEIESHLQIIV
jgi:hypothetical protein